MNRIIYILRTCTSVKMALKVENKMLRRNVTMLIHADDYIVQKVYVSLCKLTLHCYANSLPAVYFLYIFASIINVIC